jgi:hypothetical protein
MDFDCGTGHHDTVIVVVSATKTVSIRQTKRPGREFSAGRKDPANKRLAGPPL